MPCDLQSSSTRGHHGPPPRRSGQGLRSLRSLLDVFHGLWWHAQHPSRASKAPSAPRSPSLKPPGHTLRFSLAVESMTRVMSSPSITLRRWDLGGRSVLGGRHEEGFDSIRCVGLESSTVPWVRRAAWRDGLDARDQYRAHAIRTLLRFSYFSQQENQSRDRRIEQAPRS